ncbi:MAG: hydroxyacylglutathione hydrolase [Bauldia sp.]|nr:hydroxyacylglutathione hydrolase [Bauldia sp.]
MTLIIDQFPCRSDNFGVLIHDTESGLTAAIDAPEFDPIKHRLAERGWKLDQILVTHHHLDHVEGILPLKQAYGCTVIGPAGEADKIPGLDRTVKEGDVLSFGAYEIRVLDTPGHTLGHISYYIPAAKAAFVADTLFSLGCGRVIEGTMPMMWGSLEKLLALPDDTTVYVGHEYTQANARFALTIDPSNPDLVARSGEVDALRAGNKSTLPTTIGLEKRTNPFLRVDSPAVRERLGMPAASAADVFGEIRTRKDNF